MEANVVSALSAVLGSLVGGTASIVSSWVTQRTAGRRERAQLQIQRREALYAEFISEASKLSIDALDHTLEKPKRLADVYALLNRIRLTSSSVVIDAGDAVMHRILHRYFSPKMTREELHEYALSLQDDLLKPFAAACREELTQLNY